MIYVWRCRKCGQEVAVSRYVKDIDVPPKADEEPEDHFYDCVSTHWVRIISKNSFSLKGGGWGKTGYSK